MTTPMHFAVSLYFQTWCHNPRLCQPQKFASKTALCIGRFRSLGHDVSFGEWLPTFQDTLGIAGPTTQCCIQENLNSKKHCCGNHISYIKSAVLEDRYRGAMTSIMLQQCYNKVQWKKLFDKCKTWNCLPYYFILNLTLPLHWWFWRTTRISSVQVLVTIVGIECLAGLLM